VIVGVANTILSLPFGSMFAATAPTLNPTTGQLEGGGGFFATWFVANIILFVLDFAYFTIFHGMPNGQTPGKMVMKIAVRTDEGRGPLGYGKAALRTIVEIVLVWLCVIPGLVDVLFPLWDPKKQTLHDKAANTVVVRVG
jgi:uncharacterized RDD family membrane protein YckC